MRFPSTTAAPYRSPLVKSPRAKANSERRFIIDMASIACEDLADSALNAQLLAHLRSDDFFDVARHPTAQFVATAAEKHNPCTALQSGPHRRGENRPVHRRPAEPRPARHLRPARHQPPAGFAIALRRCP